MNKHKVCFIVCYFGKLPDYFKLWEISAARNKSYDFIIFSDQEYQSKYSNIIFNHISLQEINELFSKKLELDIQIKKPYKFCDFKPVYGVVFEDYITQYDFWGHCDLDQIFGNIDNFLNDSILDKYDRINHLGHFCLYKNIDSIKNLYKLSGSPFSYKEVFQSDYNYAFDEMSGIDMIAKKQKINGYEITNFVDVDVRHKRYKCFNHKNYNTQYFTYEKDKVFQNYFENDAWQKKEMMYLHFQKKKPNIQIENYDDTIYIGKKNFSNTQSSELNKYNGFIYEKMEEIVYYFNKIKKFFALSFSEKKIWIKQKGRKYFAKG